MALKTVEQVYISNKEDKSSVYTAAIGSDIKFFEIPAFTNPNFETSSLSHLWSKVNMYNEISYNTTNVPFEVGGLLGTALGYLPEAFYTYGAIGFTIPTDSFRVQLDGSNEAIYLPLDSSYTGATSGLTATTLYSSYIYTGPEVLEKDPTSLCTSCIAGEYRSEAAFQYTSNLGMGYQYIMGKNPNPNAEYPYYNSGIVYLVSDSIYQNFSGATGSSTSWSYLYNTENAYCNGKRMITFSPNTPSPWWSGVGGHDTIVGVVFVNEGFGLIFDPTLVQAIDWATVNGDPTSITGGTFTSGQTAFNTADWDFSTNLNIQVIAKPGEWPESFNPSFSDSGSDCDIAMSTMTFHDRDGMCLGVAKFDQAAIKKEDNYFIVDFDVPISQPITAQNGTLTWNGVSPL